MLELDPDRPASAAATPRASSTVLVLREHEGNLEIFCVIRHPRSSFLGGAVAFPGGKVDEADSDPRWNTLTEVSDTWAQRLGDDLPATPRALGIAACREALEEAALLPVRDATSSTSGAPNDVVDPTRTLRSALDDEAARGMRTSLEGGASLLDELASRKLFLDLAALRPFARWITPIAEARRYDATFFLLALPPGQQGTADKKETTEGFWGTAKHVLARWEKGEIQMAPPTVRALELLSACATIAEALSLADTQSMKPVCPVFVADPTAPFLALPGDPAHEIREVRVTGPTRFVLRDGRFVSEWPPNHV